MDFGTYVHLTSDDSTTSDVALTLSYQQEHSSAALP